MGYFHLFLILHFRQKLDSCHFLLYDMWGRCSDYREGIFEDCGETPRAGEERKGMKEERILSVNRNSDVEIDAATAGKGLLSNSRWHIHRSPHVRTARNDQSGMFLWLPKLCKITNISTRIWRHLLMTFSTNSELSCIRDST